MSDKPKALSSTARALLTQAAGRDDHLIPPPNLPAAAARQVARSLLNAGLAEEIAVSTEATDCAWHTGVGDGRVMLRATALGLGRIWGGECPTPPPISSVAGAETLAEVVVATGTASEAAAAVAMPTADDVPSNGSQPAQDTLMGAANVEVPEAARTESGRAGRHAELRRATYALLKAWDERGDSERGIVDEMNGPFAVLRAALATGAPTPSLIKDGARPPRHTKQARVLTMLSRDEGASGPQIAELMGWAPHTVRGFLASLAKKGIKVEVLERVRQVGPNKTGAKGSYTVYHIASGSRR